MEKDLKGLSIEELRNKIQEELRTNIAIAKPILERNLFKFNKYILKVADGKGKFELAAFHKEMCDFVADKKRNKKLILVPRGHLKSTLVTVGKSLQAICHNPQVRILIANATYNLACSFLTEIKRHLKFNVDLREFWGDMALGAETWSANDITLAQAKDFSGKKEPTVTAMGLESNMTSQHYDLIILDDLVNKDFINTTEQIQKTIDFYKESLNLLEPDGELVIVGTRWHDRDLYGWIMDTDNNVIQDFDVFFRQAYEGNLEDDNDFKPLFPGKFTRRYLKNLYDHQGPYFFSCTPARTPILMADWTTKPICEINGGDQVIGFENGKGLKKNKLIKTKVVKTMNRIGIVNEVLMESGRKVWCTPDHRWYTGRFDKTHRKYKEAKVGSRLSFVDKSTGLISFKERQLWCYLAGIVDGEGSFKSGSSITITQSRVKNGPVLDKIISVLDQLKIDYGITKRSAFKNHSESISLSIRKSRSFVENLLRYTDFGKRDQALDYMDKHLGSFVKYEDKIISIKKDKVEPVYALQTDTGNYIAWGYASSNCQYMNEPISAEDAIFKPEWFRYYEPLDLRGSTLNHFTAVDPAISMEKTADYTAIVTVALDQFNNIYVRNIIRKRLKPSEIINELFNIWEQYHPIDFALEDVAYQKALQYSLTEEMHKRQIYLPIKQVKPGTRSKDQRIQGLQPLYANGKIYHTKTIANEKQLEDELMRFPRGKNDDVIDAFSYLLDIIFPPRRRVSPAHKQHYLYS